MMPCFSCGPVDIINTTSPVFPHFRPAAAQQRRDEWKQRWRQNQTKWHHHRRACSKRNQSSKTRGISKCWIWRCRRKENALIEINEVNWKLWLGRRRINQYFFNFMSQNLKKVRAFFTSGLPLFMYFCQDISRNLSTIVYLISEAKKVLLIFIIDFFLEFFLN